MPGFDKSRFIGLRESDDELLCSICLCVFDDPLVTQCCRQTYCRDCITRWLQTSNTCPNDRQMLTIRQLCLPSRSLTNILNKLRMKCEYQSNGCNEEVLYGHYNTHTRDCIYNPESICGDCDTNIGQITQHNCVQVLNAKNKQLETIVKHLSVKNARLERMNTNILRKNLEYKQTIIILRHCVEIENAIEVNANQTKRFHKSFQIEVRNIDNFFRREQTIYGKLMIEYGFEWKVIVNNINVNQCKYLGLHLQYERITCPVMFSKLNVEFNIIRQYINRQNVKNTLKQCYVDVSKFYNNYCGYSDFIESKNIFDANNCYIKDNCIILDVTISSAD